MILICLILITSLFCNCLEISQKGVGLGKSMYWKHVFVVLAEHLCTDWCTVTGQWGAVHKDGCSARGAGFSLQGVYSSPGIQVSDCVSG